MEKSSDVFSWTGSLECPPTICNDSVKKILCSGFVGLLWEDFADVIFNVKDATTIRKNILLHQLRRRKFNKIVQCKKDILQLKLEKQDLKNKISTLEEEYEQHDFALRQKVKKQQEISSKRSETRSRRDLLKMKYDQTNTQLRDCHSMRLICQRLMPTTCNDLNNELLMEMSNVVTSLWTGANKRQVWNTVSDNLSCIEIPVLWFHMYHRLSEDIDALIKSETTKSIDVNEKSINLGITNMYGDYISMVSDQLLYNERAANYQQNVVEFIEKIESASNNSTDVREWLALSLEVYKLEAEQKCLHDEIEKMRDNSYENNTLLFELEQLTSEIQNSNVEIMEHIKDIQQSLSLLKSAPTFLTRTKDKLNLESQKIAMMRAEGFNSSVLNNDLTIELDIFKDDLNLNALRKVMLKGDTGIYRFRKSCFSEASVSVTNSQISNITSYFPFIQTPIYSLIECYKNLILMSAYKKFESLKIEGNSNLARLSTLGYEEYNYNTLELMNLSRVVNTRTETEIEEFNDILNTWVNQTVQKAMAIIEKTVDDITFSQWTERYDLLSHMLQNTLLYQ